MMHSWFTEQTSYEMYLIRVFIIVIRVQRNAPHDIRNPQRKPDNKAFSEQANNQVQVKLAERKALMARSVSDMALVDRM